MIFRSSSTGATTTIPPAPLVTDSNGFFTLRLDFSMWVFPKYQQWDIEFSTSSNGISYGLWTYGESASVDFLGINFYNIDPTKYYQFRYRLKSRSEVSAYSPAVVIGRTVLGV